MVSTMTDTFTATFEIQRVKWAKPDGSWVIATACLDSNQSGDTLPIWVSKSKPFSLCGPLGRSVATGDLFDAVVTVETNAKWGKQLKATLCERTVRADDRAIQSFLRGFQQIGPARARMITKHFGGFQGVIDVLDTNPERLAEIDGITPERATDIAAAYTAALGRRDALLFVTTLGLPQWLCVRVIDTMGGDARAAITEDPYALMDIRGVTFKTADELARNKFKVQPDDPRRVAAAADYVLQAATNDGHCYSTIDHLTGPHASRSVDRAVRDVGLPATLLRTGFDVLAEPRQVGNYTRPPAVVIVDDRIYPAYLYAAEQQVANNMARLLQGA